MHANGFTLQTARDHEAQLLRLAAPAKILSPRPLPSTSPAIPINATSEKTPAPIHVHLFSRY